MFLVTGYWKLPKGLRAKKANNNLENSCQNSDEIVVFGFDQLKAAENVSLDGNQSLFA